MKILHLACAHKSNDTRILVKECCSLAENGHEVIYYTAADSAIDNLGDCGKSNVKIKTYDLDMRGVAINRQIVHSILARIQNKKKMVQVIRHEKPDILHIHEFELMYIAGTVKKIFPSMKIIYDVHEDNAEQYAPALAIICGAKPGGLLKKIIEKADMRYVRKADGVITVTPYLLNKLSSHNNNIVEIRNMPFDITETEEDIAGREAVVCYCGGITEERGISTLCSIAPGIHGEVLAAGVLNRRYLEELTAKYDGVWGTKVRYLGYLDRTGVNKLYSRAVVGLCTLKYNKNIYNALPSKLFEYMAAGIPVVCSDFPLWKKIVTEENCGIAVHPENAEEILDAVNRLLDNRELAQEMAVNGKNAIAKKYNWALEEEKLLNFYHKLKYE